MRKDRLIALMDVLRDGNLHTAEALARRFGVSVRSVYRDMETLKSSGVPVTGERGSGYRADPAVTLPALNLTETELEALHLALAVVGEAGMEGLSDAAASLSEKIEAVLPEDGATAPNRFGFAAYPFEQAAQGFRHMPAMRAAIKARQKLRLRLRGEAGAHVIRPLRIDYWGRIWTCIVWDETAGDFRDFRIDQVDEMTVLPGLFVDEPGKTLEAYRAR